MPKTDWEGWYKTGETNFRDPDDHLWRAESWNHDIILDGQPTWETLTRDFLLERSSNPEVPDPVVFNAETGEGYHVPFPGEPPIPEL